MSAFGGLLKQMPEGWRWLVRTGYPDEAGKFYARIESADFETVKWGRPGLWIVDHVAGEEHEAWAASPVRALRACLAARIEARKGGDGEAGSVHESRISCPKD